MRKIIRECQNRQKALELKLEQSVNRYDVILAGMTINLKPTCVGGNCSSTDVVVFDNLTYKLNSYANLDEASNAYSLLKGEFID